jgi:signal transduction histidine kinase
MIKTSVGPYPKKIRFNLNFIALLEKRINWHFVRPILHTLYGLIVIGLGLIIIETEQSEHFFNPGNSKAFYYSEVVLILLLLLAAAFLTKFLFNSLEERTRSIQSLEQKHFLGTQLALTQDISEMVRRIVQFTYTTVPTAGVKLYMYDPVRGQLNLGAHVGFDEPLHPNQDKGFNADACQACIAKNRASWHSLNACKLAHCSQNPAGSCGTCLPLVRGTLPVGLLHLYTAPGTEILPEKVKLLENVSAEMSSALGVAAEKRAREEITVTQAVHAAQMDIARDLHDTIGQNISYLRMKLEHLSETKSCGNLGMETELRQMCEVANESYDLVRGTLAVLQSGGSANLMDLLAGHGRMVADRAGFQVDFASQGNLQPLPPQAMRQLFYIFREALHNIEKHAGASQVSVEISGFESSLTLSIKDNGCGFDPGDIQAGRHYGLKFMRERIEKLKGTWTLRSAAGAGTQITIWLPYEQV